MFALRLALRPLRRALLVLAALASCPHLSAQELDARVTVNHQQVQGTNVSVFEQLENSLSEFINDRQWTNMQYQRNERIRCNFNITVTKYDEASNTIEATLMVQSTRPVYGASYTTTAFAFQDGNFVFTFQEYDKLDFRADQIDSNLTAVIAYYIYFIIGIDLDTMAPMGGTDCLQTAMTIVNNAQGLSAKGWKAFDDSKNRHALISDYLDGGMEPFRTLQYRYHRLGLDVMAENADRGRAAVTEALELLGQARENKSMSMLPQIFTEYKRDEIVNIYQGKGTAREKEALFDMLMRINASQRTYWQKIK